MASDEVERRAAELRAQREADARDEQQELAGIARPRTALTKKFGAALAAQTSHPVACVEAPQGTPDWPHGSTISFCVLMDGEDVVEAVCEIGIETAEGTPERPNFTYYFLPRYLLRFADGSTAAELKGVAEDEVVAQAVKLSVELMAQCVSEGGKIGSQEQIQRWQQEDADRRAASTLAAKKKRARDQRMGCLFVFVGFLGLCALMGILGNLAECSALAC